MHKDQPESTTTILLGGKDAEGEARGDVVGEQLCSQAPDHGGQLGSSLPRSSGRWH